MKSPGSVQCNHRWSLTPTLQHEPRLLPQVCFLRFCKKQKAVYCTWHSLHFNSLCNDTWHLWKEYFVRHYDILLISVVWQLLRKHLPYGACCSRQNTLRYLQISPWFILFLTLFFILILDFKESQLKLQRYKDKKPSLRLVCANNNILTSERKKIYCMLAKVVKTGFRIYLKNWSRALAVNEIRLGEKAFWL